ncbi:hypothetical protein [Jannaschia ovalis]|uniref:Uncharacterized protein n=1 Tax=Jannaschia ovalis TaxID=3038773 RepID=A0ABY8LEM2_9RHOB|nr:hypothetical protein [Jannaschia sp. GRR-S6-38]WGH79766.1 hypothetical protein P8627_05755 [Jannaschia sp. GRR-S6-38]
MIPRAVVATALGLPSTTDALPPDDLPLDRFAARLVAYLASEDLAQDAPDAWTGAVMDHLIAEHPELALDAIRAGLPLDEHERLADALADLAERPGMADRIARAAEGDPALAALIDRANAAD